ncbi:NADP-dependent oxidoreductase [Kutzneria sp. 744]|uniref:NADP-dependent oxidoreductase n=1 Tax=Kutzneria sp. (strain 744) TaxID=345341 RepID=UPI0003EEC364|nr:NADP-dependent oxidoreductase [Kutzneria sp. 744]EWM10863.1 oxidoreductase [Kutzneria sp. 744]
MSNTYRAVEYREHGDSSVLTLGERPVPEPGRGQVRLAVRAAGVNPFDWKVRRGLFGPSMPGSFPAVPGSDVAGVVEAVGPGVTAFAVGDEVLGAASGSYAEVALASADNLVAKPAGLSWAEAAALNTGVTTAYRALALLKLEPGETLLIDGAAGTVGTVAAQIAVARGVTVIGTASERNHQYLRSLGVKPVLYGDGLMDRVDALGQVDAALDASGRGGLPALIELTGGPERVITIADNNAGDFGVHFTTGSPDEQVPGALAEGVALAAAGKLKLSVATYPLEEAAEAQDESEEGHVRGKLVLLV